MYTAQPPPPPPPPPPMGYQPPPNAPQSSGRPPKKTTWIFLAVGVLLLIGAVGTAVALVLNARSSASNDANASGYVNNVGDDGIEGEANSSSSGSDSGQGTVGTSDTSSSSDSSSASGSSSASDTSDGSVTAGGSTPTSETTTEPTPHTLQASSITASATRESVSSLRCTKQPLAYDAQNLLDGDAQTGWGASKSDGTGQSVRVSFSGTVHLKRVGITPGYLRVAPRSASRCATVNAYEFNRKITGVRYTFDDGTSVEQTLLDDPSPQFVAADAQTQSVTITILGTMRPASADDDTIVSDAYFEGY